MEIAIARLADAGSRLWYGIQEARHPYIAEA